MPHATHFINVDLEVFASRPLGALARAMERGGAYTLHSGRWWKGGFHAAFELDRQRLSPSATIVEFGRILRHLPEPARRLFEAASRRNFSIGFQAGEQPFAFEVPLTLAALAIVTRHRAQVSIAIYAAESHELVVRSAAPATGKLSVRGREPTR